MTHPALFVFGGVALLGGFAAREVRSFERAAAAEIASNLQGAEKLVSVMTAFEEPIGIFTGTLRKATIFASGFSVDALPLYVEPMRSKAGVLRCLQLRLTDFHLRQLRVAELRADIGSCRYDLGLAKRERKVRLSKAGTGPGYARLLAQDLADFIVKKYPNLANVSVRLEKYRAFVEGDGDFGIFKSHFLVISDLLPDKHGRAIKLGNAIVFLDDKRVRDGSEQALLEAVNPVLDLNEDLGLENAITIDHIRIGKGELEVFGTATIPTHHSGATQ